MMSEEKTLIMLLVVAGLIALIYFIYKAVQDNKREEELKLEREKYEKEQEQLRIKERQKKSIEWNKQIQDEYSAYVAKRGQEEVNVETKLTEDEYNQIIEVNADNDVEINGQKLNAADFLEILYTLFVEE